LNDAHNLTVVKMTGELGCREIKHCCNMGLMSFSSRSLVSLRFISSCPEPYSLGVPKIVACPDWFSKTHPQHVESNMETTCNNYPKVQLSIEHQILQWPSLPAIGFNLSFSHPAVYWIKIPKPRERTIHMMVLRLPQIIIHSKNPTNEAC